jgi:hypothetical protein
VRTERCCWVDGLSAGGAGLRGGDGVDRRQVHRAGGLARGFGWGGGRWGGENLTGDVRGRRGVVGTNVSGHEETVDEAEDGGDAGPEEEQVEDSGGVAVEVELVDAEGSEEESEEETDDLVLAGALVLGVEPGALLGVHLGGVDGVGHEVPLSAGRGTEFWVRWFQAGAVVRMLAEWIDNYQISEALAVLQVFCVEGRTA